VQVARDERAQGHIAVRGAEAWSRLAPSPSARSRSAAPLEGLTAPDLALSLTAVRHAGVFGYAEAAAHWQRAIELCQAQPAVAAAAGVNMTRIYVGAIDALSLSGNSDRAAVVAAEADRCFADHPEPATAAVIRHRAAYHQVWETRDAALALIEGALCLYEQEPPSADHAMAWLDYASMSLWSAQARLEGYFPMLSQALAIAEAAGATALIPRVLAGLARDAFLRGQIKEGPNCCGERRRRPGPLETAGPWYGWP
jgi:hypothetical protein